MASRPSGTPAVSAGEPMAYFAGLLATGLREVVDLTRFPDALDSGWWAVLATFEGVLIGYRFADVRRADRPGPAAAHWQGPDPGSWQSSLDRPQYLSGVRTIRNAIAQGRVYQVNLCRVLSAPLPPGALPAALAARLAAGNPAPYQGLLHTGAQWVVTASPELFLSRTGDEVTSAPVKGTAPSGAPFLAKDVPENIMITDLVRNDLGRVARPGSVVVTGLLAREEHPGLAHLVSTVRATLLPGTGWADLLTATFPPGSVSGAPKHTALQMITELEPVPRGAYCGAIGYVDGDRRRAELAVGIRTFSTSGSGAGRRLHFGTGAGITYASVPETEWAETELKAARLIHLAQGSGPVSDAAGPVPAGGAAG